MKKIKYVLFAVVLLYSCKGTQSQAGSGYGNLNINSGIENIKPADDVEKKALQDVKGMSLEERVGQLFVLDFRFNPSSGKAVYELDPYINSILREVNPGGILLFGWNFKDLKQFATLINSYKASAKRPLLMAIDEEGGNTSRMGQQNFGFVRIPTPRDIGKNGSVEANAQLATLIAKELKVLGFNTDFAPLGDTYLNEANEIVRDRTYSKDPKIVTKFMLAFVDSFEKEGVLTSVKHYPGHGGTSEDSHSQLATLKDDINTLKNRDMLPFIEGAKKGVPMMMVAHVAIPQLDPKLPATLSKSILDILRVENNYDGVLITDAMDMHGILDNDEIYIKAINAGIDILLCPSDKTGAYFEVLDGVKSGKITMERLNQSVLRVMKMKEKYKIDNTLTDVEGVLKYFPNQEHSDAVKSLNITQEDALILHSDIVKSQSNTPAGE